MLTSLAIAVAGGQPVGATSSGGRGPASDSVRLSDGGPTASAAADALDGQASDGPGGSGVVPAASASPGGASAGGWAGGPPDDWHRYHHWTDPSWPDQGVPPGGRGSAPLPARTAGGYAWDPPVTPPDEPPPSPEWTPTPGDPTGPPTTTGPAPDPAIPGEETDDPSVPGTSGEPPGQAQPGDGQPQTGALPPPATHDPLPRDPVAAGPDGEDLGLGETVDEPTPTPEPTVAARTSAPAQADAADPAPASEYRHTLIYSGLIGLALAAIGFTMVSLRRRRW